MRKLQKGQALLVVLLSMVVVLTIVLSVLSRSVTDIAVSTRGEESIRAFSAAEAGVEQALAGQGLTGSFEGAAFGVKSEKIGDGLKSFVYPYNVQAGDTATVWFVEHDNSGTLVCNAQFPHCYTGSSFSLCWGEPGKTYPNPAVMPAIEVSVFYNATPGSPSTTRVARESFDPYSGRTNTNHFDTALFNPPCVIEGKSLPFSALIDFNTLGIPSTVYNTANGLQFAVIRFIYNSDAHPFGVMAPPSAGLFPSQGLKVESTGTSGEATRRVKVVKLYSDIPSPFMSAVFTPVGVIK